MPSSFRIGPVELKNRVVRTLHGTNIGAGRLNDDLIAYHGARARGGVALTILELLGVHRTSPATLNVFDPGLPAGYEALMANARARGSPTRPACQPWRR